MSITEAQENTYNWLTRNHGHREKQETPKCFASPEMQKLRNRPLRKWLSMIGDIPEEDVRDKVLCLIWWDFFGGYMAGKNKILEEIRPRFGACTWGRSISSHRAIEASWISGRVCKEKR